VNIRDAVSYRKLKHKHPADVVLAFAEPQELNSVILYDRWRFRLARELTRDEFVAEIRKHASYPDHVAGVVAVAGNRAMVDAAEVRDVDPREVPAGMKYFYAAALV
jgi:hypothetical protein